MRLTKFAYAFGLLMLMGGPTKGQMPVQMLHNVQELGFLRSQYLQIDGTLGQVNSIRWFDLNGDGQWDLLIGSSEGLFVQWGGTFPAGRGSQEPVAVCQGREVLKISEGGSGMVWVECAGSPQAMLLRFQQDRSCVLEHTLDGDGLFAAAGGLLWQGPDERGKIQSFGWDANRNEVVRQPEIAGVPDLLSMEARDVDGNGRMDLAVTSPERGVGIWWNGKSEIDWIPETAGIRFWTFVHAVGESPRVFACEFDSKNPHLWIQNGPGNWIKEAIVENDPNFALKARPDCEFFSELDNQGRRISLVHSIVTQSVDGVVREEGAWIGYNAIGASAFVSSGRPQWR